MFLRFILVFILALAAVATGAAPLRVVADIAPVQSLVAQVMGDVGAPDLLIPPRFAPHDAALRPSQARMLQGADIVFWVGPSLTPWLPKLLKNLAGNAEKIRLSDTPNLTLLPYRGGVLAEGTDPHLWLDPKNAQIMLGEIANVLARKDPNNASLYRSNAARGQAEIAAQAAQIQVNLAPLRNTGFLVYHDSTQYFESRFSLTNKGVIVKGDANTPTAAGLAKAKSALATQQIKCVFTEPQFRATAAQTIIAQTQAKIAVADPLGSELPLGAGFYSQLLADLAQSFSNCLSR